MGAINRQSLLKTNMKMATIALVVRFLEKKPHLLEIISDDREISLLESALSHGEVDPLKIVHEHRDVQTKEDNEFGDYVEELLSQPFLRPEIREHGIQWLHSKLRIEHFQRHEAEAARIIANYAYSVYQGDPEMTDFSLDGPTTRVRIRVFVISSVSDFGTNTRAA